MPTPPRFTEADIPRLEALLQQGMSYRQIGLELSCDHTVVMKFVHKHLPEWADRRTQERTAEQPMKILILDIETMPGIRYFWDEREPQLYVNPDMIIKDKRTAAFAAKWLGDRDVQFWSEHHHAKSDMFVQAHKLLTEANGVVTYNGDRFDLPHLNLEFLRSGMSPPAPYKSVDLLKPIRRKFNFSSNKLQRVAQTLHLGSKVEHEGFPLWSKCDNGDAEAWKRMRDYNRQDVLLTEYLYLQVLPWLEKHPSHAAFHGDLRCPNCGNVNVDTSGFYRTKTRVYLQYQCPKATGGCGKWFRDAKSSYCTSVTETALS